MTLAEHFYSINYFKTERLVELTWLPGTQEMTDQDFKEALCVFAEGALQHRAVKRCGGRQSFGRVSINWRTCFTVAFCTGLDTCPASPQT